MQNWCANSTSTIIQNERESCAKFSNRILKASFSKERFWECLCTTFPIHLFGIQRDSRSWFPLTLSEQKKFWDSKEKRDNRKRGVFQNWDDIKEQQKSVITNNSNSSNNKKNCEKIQYFFGYSLILLCGRAHSFSSLSLSPWIHCPFFGRFFRVWTHISVSLFLPISPSLSVSNANCEWKNFWVLHWK